MTYSSYKKGFTLIELILYIGISTIILLSITTVLGALLEARVKNQVINEVEQQGTLLIERIAQAVRNANSVTSPSVGNSSTSLTLTDSDDVDVVFDVASGRARMTVNGSAPVYLTNTQVAVENFLFENFSRTDTLDLIRISFTLSYTNVSGRYEYEYSTSFNASASLR